jgi:hypothetical protein
MALVPLLTSTASIYNSTQKHTDITYSESSHFFFGGGGGGGGLFGFIGPGERAGGQGREGGRERASPPAPPSLMELMGAGTGGGGAFGFLGGCSGSATAATLGGGGGCSFCALPLRAVECFKADGAAVSE